MTKEQIEKRVAELVKQQENLNNNAEENAKMVIDILDRFYYKDGEFTRKMYIKKSVFEYMCLWYCEPEKIKTYNEITSEAIKIATETGEFDDLLEHILNVAIPYFITHGCNIPDFRPDNKKSHHKDDPLGHANAHLNNSNPEVRSFGSFEEFMEFLITRSMNE